MTIYVLPTMSQVWEVFKLSTGVWLTIVFDENGSWDMGTFTSKETAIRRINTHYNYSGEMIGYFL